MLGLGLGLNKGVPLALYKILARTCGLLSYSDKVDSGIMYDKLGQTRDAVLSKSLDGDGSMYAKFNQYTDLNLPSNFEIELTCKITDFSANKGLFGIDASGSDNFYVRTNSIEGQFFASVSGQAIILNTSVISGDIISLKLIVKNSMFKLSVNEQESTELVYTNPLTNKPLEIFSVGEGAIPSNHVIYTFKIINTDTGKTYTLDIPGLSSDIIQLVNLDDSSDFIQGTLMLPSATPTSFTDKVVSIEDMYGYSSSKALGKNLFDENVETIDNSNWNLAYDNGIITVTHKTTFTTGRPILELKQLKQNTDYTFKIGQSSKTIPFDLIKNGSFYTTLPVGVSRTFNTGTDNWDISPSSSIVETFTASQLMLNEGSTPTTYEPYKGYSRDALLTQPYKQGAIIPCDKRGISFSYISDGAGGSLQPRADYVGKIANNFVKCDSDGTINPSGLYVKNDQVYGHITSTDENEVLWNKTLQEVKTVLFENINYNNQFFINADETRISYYEAPLTEPCLTRALSLMKL